MRQTDRQTDGRTDGLMPPYRREGHINNQCLLPGVFFCCQGQATVLDEVPEGSTIIFGGT